MRLLVTRPSEDAGRLNERLRALGHEGIAAPLLEVHFIAGDAVDLSGVQGILFTSANGVRAFAERSTDRTLPALCVGDATGREARAVGFSDVRSAAGDVAALAALVAAALDPKAGDLLHPAGTKVAGDLAGLLEAEGFHYRREVLYEAVKAKTLPDVARKAMVGGTVHGVLLYSPRTGAAFAKLVLDAGLNDEMGKITAYCLSEAVASEVRGLPWKTVLTASQPNEEALLALLA
ncbi:MAG TPA: uroporphyrinogen-III synthase [Magnetovibrio sp.]